jgi:hypothetical protein
MITNPSLAFIYGMIGGLLSVLGFLIDDKLKGLGKFYVITFQFIIF